MKGRILGAFLALAMTTGLAAAVGPVSTASAVTCATYYDTIIDREYIDGNGRFNPCGGRPVDYINGIALAGQPACVGAYDIASGTWAGTTVCANGSVDHYYNNTNRLGWGGVPYGTVYVNSTFVWW